jgi:FIMAH domain
MIPRLLLFTLTAARTSSLFVVMGLTSAASGQQLPLLQAVTVQSNVNSAGSVFIYSYTVGNTPPNVAPVSKVDVDITLPTGGANLSADGLQNGQGFIVNIADTVRHDPRTPAMIPVALSAPPGWLATVSVGGTASWIARSDDAAVVVGGSTSGYQIASPGLPAIRQLTVEADYDVNALAIIPPTDPGDLPRYNKDLAAAVKNFRTTAFAVAPTAPPVNFQPIQFLQTIEDYKEHALKQGWITSPGVANSLDVKLNAALAALQEQDTITAKKILNALLNEVEAQDGKHLTSEAVALLQFNTQYLISKLP